MSNTLSFIEGEFGFTHVFQFPTGTDLSAFTSARLVITVDSDTTPVYDKTTNLTIGTDSVDWDPVTGETDYNGLFVGTLHLINASSTQKVLQFPVNVTPKIV